MAGKTLKERLFENHPGLRKAWDFSYALGTLASAPYVISSFVRWFKEDDDNVEEYEEQEDVRGAGFNIGVFLDFGQLIAYTVLAKNGHPEFLLIPATTNVLSLVYELGVRKVINKVRDWERKREGLDDFLDEDVDGREAEPDVYEDDDLDLRPDVDEADELLEAIKSDGKKAGKREYRVGQQVTIRRNLGTRKDYPRNFYYHSGDVQRMPLGTKGIIKGVVNREDILIATDKGGWHVHPDELASSEEEEEREYYDRIKDGLVDELLSGDEVRIKEGTKIKADGKSKKNALRKFEPKFNPREEFVVWIRSRFPKIPVVIERREGYGGYDGCDCEQCRRRRSEPEQSAEYREFEEQVKRDRREYYKALVLACKHGTKTAESCVQGAFKDYLGELRWHRGYRNVARIICKLVPFMEKLSANLPHEVLHYGTTNNMGRLDNEQRGR